MKTIQAAQLGSFLDRYPEVIVIDVRFAYERDEVGYLAQSQHIPWYTPEWEINADFVSEVAKLVAQQGVILMVCRSGHRSCDAGEFLEQHGYQQVYNLHSGFVGLADLPMRGLRNSMPFHLIEPIHAAALAH